jgi:hypothetical protein
MRRSHLVIKLARRVNAKSPVKVYEKKKQRKPLLQISLKFLVVLKNKLKPLRSILNTRGLKQQED